MRGILGSILVCLLVLNLPSANAWDKRDGWKDSSRSADPRDIPTCLDNRGNRIDQNNNDQVIQWKSSTPSGYHDRGLINGTLVGVLSDKGDHLHLDVFLGQTPSGRGKDSDIEIVYNRAFGNVSERLTPGMNVIACGDFINSFKQNGRYPPSPVGAILHWVHKSMNNKHLDGFLMIDGKLYGQEDAPPRRFYGDQSFVSELFDFAFAQ